MSDHIESQGKTVEEAVSEALLQLGARQEEVEVTVLEKGKSGFLGLIGGRPARVLVRRKPGGRDDQRRGGGRGRGSAPAGGRGGRGGARDGVREAGQRGRERPAGRTAPARTEKAGPPRPQGRRPAAQAEPARPTHDAVKAITRAEALRGIAEAEIPGTLEKMVSELLRLSGFPCRCEVKEGDYHLVKVITDDSSAGVLIGRHGTTADAVEHLIERMSSQAFGNRVNMNLDINNYRRRREEALVERTQSLSGKVKATGREVHMEPLCARERRIVHMEVAKVDGLRTYTLVTSTGKHVVIAKEGAADQEAGADAGGSSSQAGNYTTPDAGTPRDEATPDV